MMQMCYNAVFRHIFLSMTFLTCWQIFPDYAAPPCTGGIDHTSLFFYMPNPRAYSDMHIGSVSIDNTIYIVCVVSHKLNLDKTFI